MIMIIAHLVKLAIFINQIINVLNVIHNVITVMDYQIVNGIYILFYSILKNKYIFLVLIVQVANI